MPYDTIIRNGTIVDGTGALGRRADLAIAGDRIAEIGAPIRDTARRVIDATGLVVSPGFIDGHTHMDAQVMWDPLGTCSCWHGITTVVMGNCGFTLAPVRPGKEELVVRSLERAEDISAEAMAEGIRWSWGTFTEYLDAVDRLPKGINYAANIGHSALRTWSMGERAFEEAARPEDLELMALELRSALRAGAIGFTTSRTHGHQTSDGRPVASRQADWDEVCQLIDVMGDEGRGIFEIAPGPGGTGDPDDPVAAMREIAELAARTRVPVTVPVLAVRPSCYETLALLDNVASRGGRFFGQTHSRGVDSVLSFRAHLPFDTLPEWQEIRSHDLEEQKYLLSDPVVRKRLVWAAHNSSYGQSVGAEARKANFDQMHVLDNPIPPNPTVAEIAKGQEKDPVEVIIDLSLEANFDRFFVQPIVPQEPDDAVAVMKHPRTVMTFSDSGAHVSQIMDASIQTHLLAYWVRQERRFGLEEAVRMLTSVAADAWGFLDRGRLLVGNIADINVFNAGEIGPSMPTVVRDLPGGATRLEQRAKGIAATIVGGQVVILDGKHTGALPGKLLRQ